LPKRPPQAGAPPTSAPAPAAAAPAAVTGGAAILARLRAQRASSGAGARTSASGAAAAREPPRAAFLYASQTGTGAEIARTLAAEAKGHGVAAVAMSLNELGWANFRAERTPVAVIVASSTGDGDPPDDGAAFFVTLKKPHPAGTLAGVRFAVLGLGDSNYTRFMYVPRTLRSRLADLGATEFYAAAEADEVDGLESKVAGRRVGGRRAADREALQRCGGAGRREGGRHGTGRQAGAEASAIPGVPVWDPPPMSRSVCSAACPQPSAPPHHAFYALAGGPLVRENLGAPQGSSGGRRWGQPAAGRRGTDHT
jgi:flavodoxin